MNDEVTWSSGPPPVNRAAFAIHSQVHAARPDLVAAAHAHSMYGRSFSAFGRTLQPLTQDAAARSTTTTACSTTTGVVLEVEEGQRIAKALGPHKAVILRNHGLLTGGASVDEAAWWFISDGAVLPDPTAGRRVSGRPVLIDPEQARITACEVGPRRPAGSASSRCTT